MSTNVDNTAAGKTDHKRGFNVTAWSIEHPYTIWAFYLAMIILAFVAIGYYMPKRLMPYVQSPMIGIVSMQPGLSAEEMETFISKPIEERMVDSDEPTSRCQTSPSMWTLGGDQPVIPMVTFVR